jgi:AcrR family transcriptional regulator
VNDVTDLEAKLRNVPIQARSRERLRRVLDAADHILATEGPDAFTTTRIAAAAEVPVGSVYRYFPDKQAIVEALALSYWSDFEDLVAGVAEAAEESPLENPTEAILSTLAAGFRVRPGFLALWYGGLRTEAVRDVTRPTRTAIARSVERVLAVSFPAAPPQDRAVVARMVTLAGDGLLREAFRLDRVNGDDDVLAESVRMLDAYASARLLNSK